MTHHRPYAVVAISLLLISASTLIAQNVITCSSNDMKRHFCDMGHFRDARLVKQRSGSPCIRGNTWGIQGRSIWVDRGCRADFQLIGMGGPQYGGKQIVRCESNNMNYRRCAVPGRIQNAQVARQISGSPCVQGQSWGFDRDGLWVNRGCRADFAVWLR